MVRRTINEVLDIANDNNISIYDRTADSIHFDLDKVHILKQKYKERYGRELSEYLLIQGGFLIVK